MDGVLTLDENIADNGGLREAIIAYQRYVAAKGTEPLLDGFENLDHQQLLILSFANVRSSKITLFTYRVWLKLSKLLEQNHNARCYLCELNGNIVKLF